jgi:hypothetical protein
MKKRFAMITLLICLLFTFGTMTRNSVSADYDDVSFESADAPTPVDGQ